ncbi:MAG: outer membrane protein assembly factor BamD, partial [Cyanobacteria bacterium P01_D01_bin.115]
MDESLRELYQNGALALKQARYDDAITNLERFCKAVINRQSKEFFQAQMWLIQAYHKDQKDLHAISLCEKLTKSDIP